MTVVIVGTGTAGETAAGALADREVCRVETIEGARNALADATLVVVGDLADDDPGAVRAAACEAGVPTVGLVGPEAEPGSGTYDATADPGDPEAVRAAVALARDVGEYRAAVDELYERARARAEGEAPDDDRDLAAIRDRANRRLRAAREATGRTPYEALFTPRSLVDDPDGDGGDDRDPDTEGERERPDGDEHDDGTPDVG